MTQDFAAERPPPFLSVVIPAHNEERLLGRCLRSLRDASAGWADAGRPVELIVCDNASTDATAEVARKGGARVAWEPARQIARARNRGAAAARGEWLLFVDADSFPSRPLFDALAAALARPDCAGGGALIELDHPRGFGGALMRFWNGVSRWTRWAPGSFLFCRMTAFRELGGFDETLYVSEELDFSRRLKRWSRRRGQRMIVLRGARLLTSARKLDLYSRREMLGFIWRYLRHPRRTPRDRDACPIWYDGRR